MDGPAVTDMAAPPPGIFEQPESQHGSNGLAGQKRDFHGGYVSQQRYGDGGGNRNNYGGQSGPGQESFVKLFVGSVPRTIREEEVRPMFEEFGKVVEVALIKDKNTGMQRGCCFVKYTSLEEAEKAIRGLNNQRNLPGSSAPVQVRFADGERERLGIGAASEFKLFVGSLNKSANEKEIEAVFDKYGPVDDVYIMRDAEKNSRGCAFVKFSTRESAQAAIDGLHGVFTMEGMDQPVAVRFADPKRPRPGDARVGGPGAGFQNMQQPFSPGRGPRGGPGGPGAGRPAMGGAGWRPMGGPGMGPSGGPGGNLPMQGPGSMGPRGPYGGPGAAPMMGAPMAGAPMQMAPMAAPGQMGAPGMAPQQPMYYQQPPMQQPQQQGPPQQMYAPPQQQQQLAAQPQMGAPQQVYYQQPPLQQAAPQQQMQQQPQTQQAVWQQPQAVQAPVAPQAVAPAPAPAPTTCDWTEHTSPEGHKYYYNSATQESRWEKPPELAAFEASQQPPLAPPQQMIPQQQPQQAAAAAYPQQYATQATGAPQAVQGIAYPQQTAVGTMQQAAPQQQQAQPQQQQSTGGAPNWGWTGMPTGT